MTGYFHSSKNMASLYLESLPTAELNTVVPGNIMNTNCTWPWKISTIPGQKQNIRKPMASVKGSTEPYRMNFMLPLSERRSTTHYRNCRMIWTSGWKNITTSEPIPGSTAMAEHPCKHFWKPYL